MREIVYFYVTNFRNIHNQGFNFGCEYEYYAENIGGEIIVSRKKNDLYIPNFFHTDNSDSIINISAFVGENGAGKSTLIDALKFALAGDRDWFDYIVVFKDANGDVHCRHSENCKVKYEFEQSEGTSALTKVIYYSPSLDSKIYPITHDNNVWIDISTDWLIFKDSEDQKETKPNLSQIELFNAEEIERQIKLFNDTDFTAFLNGKINIPSEIRFLSVACDFPSSIANPDSHIRNVPYNFRKYYDLLNEKGKVVNDYALKEKEYRVQNKIDDAINPFTRKKCFATFLSHLLKNMFYHFDFTNDYLTKGKIEVSFEELERLSYEEAVSVFIKKINLIDKTEVIVEFINYTEKLISEAKVEYLSYGEISWISSKDSLKNFLFLKDGYLNELSKFSNSTIPRSFISYSWSGLSTGEKAMLNLFSRFFCAKSHILKPVEKLRVLDNNMPVMLYILIDEAELGFHLQWQKEYVYDIIRYLPKTLVLETEKGKIQPKIQIIFTTHSTLTLSDIPNTHISYIKNRDKKAYVLTDEEKPRRSFGANVHTLMSDSFFLRNGLVGSFATKKINEIIKVLNFEKLTQEEIENVRSVIRIIDEPILKVKLQSMLSRFESSNEDEIKRLEQQKEDIEKRIKKLREND